jgi:NAD-dependent SIR2 family protein deacetylase
MSLVDKTLKLLEATKIIILKGDENFTCSKCNKTKSYAEFHDSQLSSIYPKCKLCVNRINRRRYHDKKEIKPTVNENGLIKSVSTILGVNNKLLDKVGKALGNIFTIKYIENNSNKYTTSTGSSKSDAIAKFKKKHSSATIKWIK